jgi:hypothetical protein
MSLNFKVKLCHTWLCKPEQGKYFFEAAAITFQFG